MLYLKKLFTKDGIDNRDVRSASPLRPFDEAKNDVIPWIKVTYPFTRDNCRDSVQQLFQGENMPVFQFWLDDLCIFYAVEKNDRYEFLLQKDMPKGMSLEALHKMAVRNLDRDISFELGKAHFGGYALIAGGNHESASVCLPHVWEWLCGELDDNLIVSIPAKHQVYICPERDQDNIVNMKILVHEYFKKGDRLLTRNIFRVDRRTLEWTVVDTVGIGERKLHIKH
ncbi:MAG TPA: hypothetical protein VL547_19285 [Dinghuibacter sp.]|uniref:hypothetical protein n=1 Tax=Dinghuibacter sp. TaxID=2024697 RepID=UPI002D1C52F2|nr:hypothetical protein [Dinghuibacter sp.]HTJ14195.1 hypothetical protein [Dinghuibacter sp.]